jgi:hypothetical protein
MPAPKSIRASVYRFAVVAATAALAACASGGATNVPPQPAVAANTQAAQAPEPVSRPPSILHARAECWNKLEADRKAPRDLEKRAAIVQKCTDDRMRGLPATTTQ